MIKYMIIILSLLMPARFFAQDAQFRGPDRNGVFPDTGLLKIWPESGPEKLFSVSGLGKSYSSAVATEYGIFVSGLIDSMDVLSAISYDGKIRWQKSFGKGWDQSFPETRCTPTIADGRVYVLSGKDNLACFEENSGNLVWEVDVHHAYSSEWDMFGVSESVLLIGDKLILTPCGTETTVIALDKDTGALIWKSEPLGVERSNASAVLFRNDSLNMEMIIAMNRTHVLGLDPEDGEILWTYHYNILSEKGDNATILANSPLFHNDEILISNGWDNRSVMLELAPDGRSVSEKYIDNTLDNQNHGLVRVGDFVYGSNFLTRAFGKWVCMRWDNGEIMWVEEWETKGPIIAAEGMFYLQDEKRGNVALVKADEKSFEVISEFKVDEGRGPFWARPSIYNSILFIRHGEFLLAYDIGNK